MPGSDLEGGEAGHSLERCANGLATDLETTFTLYLSGPLPPAPHMPVPPQIPPLPFTFPFSSLPGRSHPVSGFTLSAGVSKICSSAQYALQPLVVSSWGSASREIPQCVHFPSSEIKLGTFHHKLVPFS